jgi:hypothetical protein
MDERITSFIGLDAHAESNAIGVADAGQMTAPRAVGTLGGEVLGADQGSGNCAEGAPKLQNVYLRIDEPQAGYQPS